MAFVIAIQPDEIQGADGSKESYSDRWISNARGKGLEVRIVDVFKDDLINQLKGCDGFMWRFPHAPFPRLFAKRLLPAIEQGLGLVTFPDSKTCWHYDDKIAQSYLLEAANIPIPKTWIFWKHQDALSFCREASYPIIIKLYSGASSQNVRLLNNYKEAKYWIKQLFSSGVYSLEKPADLHLKILQSRLKDALKLLIKGWLPDPGFWYELHKNYILVQEFLPNNPFDTRIIVIGNKAFGYRRLNRENDFRASGSGMFDLSSELVDIKFVHLAFKIINILKIQCCCIDGLYRGDEHVIAEISYTWGTKGSENLNGFWMIEGPLKNGNIIWKNRSTSPRDLIFEDFIAKIENKKLRK